MNYYVNHGEEERLVSVEETGVAHFKVVVGDEEMWVDAHRVSDNTWSVIIDNRVYEIDLFFQEEDVDLLIDGDTYSLRVLNEQKRALRGVQEAAGGGETAHHRPHAGEGCEDSGQRRGGSR